MAAASRGAVDGLSSKSARQFTALFEWMRTLPPRHLGMSRCRLVRDMAQHVDALVVLPFQHLVLLNAVVSADEVAVELPHLRQT